MTGLTDVAAPILRGFPSPTSHSVTPPTDPDADPVLGGMLTQSTALTLVQCAVLAYKSQAEIKKALRQEIAGGLRFFWFEAVGHGFDSQAFACVVPGHVILAFRGTKELRDFLTDAKCCLKPLKDFNGTELDGLKVHKGFQKALNALWSDERTARQKAYRKCGDPIDKFLNDISKEDAHKESHLWLTGHSLGAALATIAAARIRLTKDAPFKCRIGGLVTIGSPRVLNDLAAKKLQAELTPERICRIQRSIDPVPRVPYWGRYSHVTGRQHAFVTSAGNLCMDTKKINRWLDRSAAWLLATEDFVGSALPGRHLGLSRFVSDHSSDDYVLAVMKYEKNNHVSLWNNVRPIAAPILKLGGAGAIGWATAITTGAVDKAVEGVTAIASLLQSGAAAMLAFML